MLLVSFSRKEGYPKWVEAGEMQDGVGDRREKPSGLGHSNRLIAALKMVSYLAAQDGV